MVLFFACARSLSPFIKIELDSLLRKKKKALPEKLSKKKCVRKRSKLVEKNKPAQRDEKKLAASNDNGE